MAGNVYSTFLIKFILWKVTHSTYISSAESIFLGYLEHKIDIRGNKNISKERESSHRLFKVTATTTIPAYSP
jgi:hypothetical protein